MNHTRHIVSFQFPRGRCLPSRQRQGAGQGSAAPPFCKKFYLVALAQTTKQSNTRKIHNRCQVKHSLILLLFLSLSSRDIEQQSHSAAALFLLQQSEANLHSASTATTLTSSIKWHPLARHRRSSSEVLVTHSLLLQVQVLSSLRLDSRLVIQPRFSQHPHFGNLIKGSKLI